MASAESCKVRDFVKSRLERGGFVLRETVLSTPLFYEDFT